MYFAKSNIVRNYLKIIVTAIIFAAITAAKIELTAETMAVPQSAGITLSVVMQELIPLILNESKFQDPDNNLSINQNLDKLEQIFNQIPTNKPNLPINFRISVEVITRQIKAAKKAFVQGEYIYARFLLKSLPEACVAYYSQEEYQLHSSGMPIIHEESFETKLDLAEYYYLTRAYPQALHNYKNFIINNISKEDPEQLLQIAIERILSIYVQKLHQPDMALIWLQEFKNKLVFPEYLSIYMDEWLKGLNLVKATFKDVKINQITFSQLERYIKKYFHDEPELGSLFVLPKSDQMFYLMLSGYINDYLYTNPKQQEIPPLLYWGSVCDRALNYHNNTSVADLYLKECIIASPKSKYAKKCLAEYDEYITLSYNSDDAAIPKRIIKEMAYLRNLVYPNK